MNWNGGAVLSIRIVQIRIDFDRYLTTVPSQDLFYMKYIGIGDDSIFFSSPYHCSARISGHQLYCYRVGYL